MTIQGIRFIIVLILLFSLPFVSARSTTLLSTQLILAAGENTQFILYAPEGELSIESSITQGVLNLTILQTNATITSFEVNPTAGTVSKDVLINQGEFNIQLQMSNNFIPSIVNLTVVDNPTEIELGYVVTGGVLILLLLPFVYIIGKNQGSRAT